MPMLIVLLAGLFVVQLVEMRRNDKVSFRHVVHTVFHFALTSAIMIALSVIVAECMNVPEYIAMALSMAGWAGAALNALDVWTEE